MYILGAVISGHDSSVCLLKDGKIVCAISDKRLSRVKYRFENNSIRKSLEYVLAEQRLDINDIGLICCDTSFVYPAGESPQDIFLDYENKQNIVHLNHHLGHGASAFLPSPFSEAAVLTMDACGAIAPLVKDRSMFGQTNSDLSFQGRGFIPAHEYQVYPAAEARSESISLLEIKRGGKFKELDNYYVSSSLGFFYGHMSHYLFMEEGELMGLAGYGKESAFCKYMEEVVLLLPEGKVELNPEYINCWQGKTTMQPPVDLRYLTAEFYKVFGAKRKLHDPLDSKAMDFAFAVQKRLEDAVVHLANHLAKLSSSTNICIAGGVGLNSVANHKIIERTPFEHIWIQPAATDDGIAIGNALFAYYVLSGLPKKSFYQMNTASLGKTYTNSDIEQLLKSYKEEKKLIVEYRKDDVLIKNVDLLWSVDNQASLKRQKMTYCVAERKYIAAIEFNEAKNLSYYFETFK